MNINFLRFYHSRPIYNSHIPPWAYPNGFVGLNVKLEHMTRVYYSELLAKNALKAEKIRISILIPLCYYRELHIQISERARALLDLKVGVRIGGTFSTVTLAFRTLLSCPCRVELSRSNFGRMKMYKFKSYWLTRLMKYFEPHMIFGD